jgi:hypothetical protein
MTNNTQKLWWLSWNQAAGPSGIDSRPVSWPPPAAVLAFWQSGFAADGSYSTVVALVRAQTSDEAARIITRAWSPGVDDWRFNDELDASKPPGDRFPAPDWSVELGRWPWPVAPRPEAA